MGLIASLPDIDKRPGSVFVMHEKSEKLIPLHKHTKGQLSYVEGGLAYVVVNSQTFFIPPRHFFWIPKGMPHILKVGLSATVFRSLYFFSGNDSRHPFYSQLGIYPASELLIQMITYTERWDGRHVDRHDENFEFMIALKNLLPQFHNQTLSIVLPTTNDDRLNTLRMIKALEMLLKTKKTVGEIAYSVGYDTLGEQCAYHASDFIAARIFGHS